MSSTLKVGRAASLAVPDVSRFTRLETLRLRSFSPQKAIDSGWRLGLPASLRTLHLVELDAAGFEVANAAKRLCSNQTGTFHLHPQPLVLPHTPSLHLNPTTLCLHLRPVQYVP
jgi:hypothetical protein